MGYSHHDACDGGVHDLSESFQISVDLLNSSTRKRMVSSGRCLPKTLSVSSEFEGKAGLAGWIGASGPRSAILFFSNIVNIMM